MKKCMMFSNNLISQSNQAFITNIIMFILKSTLLIKSYISGSTITGHHQRVKSVHARYRMTNLQYFYGPLGHPYDCFPKGLNYIYIIN